MLYRGSPLRLDYESNSGPTAGALQDLRSEGFLRLHARCRRNEDLPLCGDIFIIRKDHSSKAIRAVHTQLSLWSAVLSYAEDIKG